MKLAWLVAGTVVVSGCVIEHSGPVRHETRVIDRDNADQVRVDVRMSAGNLRISPGDDKLLRADFDYNVPSWKPEVRYDAGDLRISQADSAGHSHLGDTRSEWDLRLNPDVPLDIRVQFGAGEARMNVGHLSLRDVAVEMGVGKMDMDLRGEPEHSYTVSIHGGVGEATVRLPAGVGVDAHLEGGIGEIHAPGFHREGGRYINDEYAHSKYTIHLDVQGGIGAIHLIS